jgi:hypothetical protein
LVITSDRGSPTGNDFANAVLIARHRPEKLAVLFRQRPQTVHVVGKDDPSDDMEWRTGAHLPNRIAQSADSRHQQVRPPVKEVHCKEEGSSWNPIAAIVRHERSMPGLAERRNTLPLFRPTLAASKA